MSDDPTGEADQDASLLYELVGTASDTWGGMSEVQAYTMPRNNTVASLKLGFIIE